MIVLASGRVQTRQSGSDRDGDFLEIRPLGLVGVRKPIWQSSWGAFWLALYWLALHGNANDTNMPVPGSGGFLLIGRFRRFSQIFSTFFPVL